MTLTGLHLIAGEWVEGGESFAAVTMGDAAPLTVQSAGAAEVRRAADVAEAAFADFAATSRADRAAFLRAIAGGIDARRDAIVPRAVAESGLPEARLVGETGRTTGQLRLFADHIEAGRHLDLRHDPALPDRKPAPRPDLRLVQRPLGPVAVFGASNFPLAFSTAGGDTASALAAGCPVIVKGHPAHPGTSELVAGAILDAIRATGMPAGVFALLQGDSNDLGHAVVRHPLIKAIGFTGSFGAGRALFDLCAARPEPIPFFGELGAVNPVFVLPAAAAARGGAIGAGWAASLTMGVGQFCTNPGVAFAIDGAGVDALASAAADGVARTAPQPMLTHGIAGAYRAGIAAAAAAPGVATLACGPEGDDRHGTPALFQADRAAWEATPALRHENFGPSGVLVRLADFDAMLAEARGLDGQLTCTIQMDDADADLARRLLPVLERKAGRILFNGFPTGVEVADAMVHGGPYPASTNFGATSVGTLAIRRFLRPVCFQDMPAALLPDDLTGA